MMITVLGPDGSGKTTLARKLSEGISELEYIYFGNNIESRKYQYFNKFIRTQKKGKLNTLLKYIFITINDWYYYRLSRSKNLISDRCPVDKLLGYKINRSIWRYIYHRLATSIMPNPAFVILLIGNPELIYLRKKEISSATIKLYIDWYRKYLQKNKIKHIIIDTSKYDVEETYRIAKEEIMKIL